MNIDNKTDKKITLVNYGYDRETIVLGEEILSVGRPIICFDEENTDEKITDEEGTNDGDSNYKSKKGKWQPIKLSAKECLDDKHTFAKQTSSQVQKQIEHDRHRSDSSQIKVMQTKETHRCHILLKPN